MRIGVDVRPLTVPTFGIGRYTKALLERLIVLGEHHWFLYADRPLPGEWPTNVTVRHFSTHNRLMSLGRTQLTFAHWAALDELDVFWSPRHHLPVLLDLPQVVTVHDLVWKKFPETMVPANRMIERLLMPGSVRLAQKVIAVSEATRNDLINDLDVDADKIHVVYEAADDRSNSCLDRKILENYFFFVGTNEPRKNLDRLVAAHKKYLHDGGDHSLVIAGSAGWGENLTLHDGVKVLGYVSDERLDNLISHSSALLLPSLYEGFGLPLLEAIQRNVPVISSDVSSMPEIVGNAGILVNPQSVTSISSAMEKMSRLEVRNLYAKNCVAQAAKFSWDDAAQATSQILESVVR